MRFRPRLTYANAMSTVAVFVALGGGAYAAASSIEGAGGVIHGCYQAKKGNLRVLSSAGKRCSKGEKAIEFDKQGPRGLPGATGPAGAAGAPGLRGEPGPQGPGATSFTAEVPVEREQTIATLTDGLEVKGVCQPTFVRAEITTTDEATTTIQTFGTSLQEGKLDELDEDEGTAGILSTGKTAADFDITARGDATAKFEHLYVHGSWGASSCTFWGMIVPSG